MKRLVIGSLTTLVLTAGPWLSPYPSLAQFADVRQQLSTLPTSRVAFTSGTSSATIENAVDEIYILRARAGQILSLKANSLGARASVTLYGVNGKPLGSSLAGFNGEGKEIRVRLPQTGDYYIVGGAGPTNHFYNFTVTIR